MKAQAEATRENVRHPRKRRFQPCRRSNAVIESAGSGDGEPSRSRHEVLDARIDGLRDEMNARFAAQDEEIRNLSKSVVRLEDKVDTR